MQVDVLAIGVLFAFLCLLTSSLLLVLIQGMNRGLRWGGKAFQVSLSSLQSYYYQMLVRLGMELIVTSCRQARLLDPGLASVSVSKAQRWTWTCNCRVFPCQYPSGYWVSPKPCKTRSSCSSAFWSSSSSEAVLSLVRTRRSAIGEQGACFVWLSGPWES